MKEKNSSWALIAPVVVLVLIGTIVTAALAVTNQVTAPIIAEQQAKAADAAKQVVLPNGTDFAPVESLEGMPAEVISVEAAGNGAGYVITTETKGFGGAIQSMFGIDPSGVITGSRVLVHAESEGIGAVVAADNSEFQQQLIGMSDTANIQARSGATVTSNAMKNAVQAALNAYTILSGGTIEATVYESPNNLTDSDVSTYFPGVSSVTEVVGGKVTDKGTVVYAAAQGLNGLVKVAVFFDQNDSIVGLVVDPCDETPGLGTLAAEKDYTDQFIGVSSADEVDVLSGATFSSTAVKDSVNIAIANLETVKNAPETDAPVIAPAVTAQPEETPAADADSAKGEVLPGGADFAPVTDAAGLPDAVVSVDKAGNGAGYVITTETKGFGGAIQTVFGVDADGAITGSKVLSHSETEGIGSRVVEDGSDFQAQLVGMADASQVQATSGATLSSAAMTDAVKAVFDAYAVLTGGAVAPAESEAPAESQAPVETAAPEETPAPAETAAPAETPAPAAEPKTISASAQGLLSTVNVTVTFDANGVITALSVDASGETQGIGSQAAESSYTSKFIGATNGNGVDAITGATVTSTAVKDAVNSAAAQFKSN